MSLLDDVSIVVTPNGYKAGTLYGVLPLPTEGSDLVTNGNFATDSNWSKGTGWTISGGAANVNSTSNTDLYQNVGTSAQKTYKVTYTVSNYVTGSVKLLLGYGSSPESPTFVASANGTYEIIQKTNTTNPNVLYISTRDATSQLSIDNVSVKEYTSADMDVTRATAATRVDENGLVNYAEVLGGELVTNNDYTNGLTGWNTQIPSGQIVEVTSNQLHINYDSSQTQGSTGVYQSILTLTKTYKTTIDVASVTGTFKVQVGNVVHTITTAGIKTFINVASDAELFIVRKSNGQSFEARINSVSIKEVTRDNVPRIDYTGGGCPHILAEPQRTNLITYSEDFSNASWLKVNSTVTPNTSVSPSGTLNSDEFIPDNTTASIFIYNQVTFSASDYTLSFFIKYNGRQYVQLLFGSNVSTDFSNFDLINHTVTSGNGSIEDYGNDWYKISLTSNVSAASSEVYLWSIDSATSLRASSSTGNGTDGYYVYGGQLEQGSYPTSYIPTSGQSGGVTRNQDIFTRDGIGSLINSTEGVLFAEMAALANDLTFRSIGINSGSATNRILISFNSTSNNINALVQVGGVTQASINYAGATITNFNKIAYKYKGNDFALWVNGVEVGTDTSGNTFSANTLTTLDFTNANSTDNLYAKVKQLQVYDTSLTDNQLIQLTGEAGTHFFESYAEMASALTYTIQ